MTRAAIAINDLNLNIFHTWDQQWFLLTAGDFASGKYNPMTVSWGSLGVLWRRPFAMVVVRPQRFTRGLLEAGDSFTLSAFDPSFRPALNVCGTKSGRDLDKVKATGLTPLASTQVAAPAFAEAELILECRKMYHDRIKPENFLAAAIAENYPAKDYHHVYFGEVVAVFGTPSYRRAP